MDRKTCRNTLLGCGFLALTLTIVPARAAIERIDLSRYTFDPGVITFSEPGLPIGTTSPTYNPVDYGGGALSATVHFGGYFLGQKLGGASDCTPGTALTGCVVGVPTGPLTLDPSSPGPFITEDPAMASTPTISGSPKYNGPISLLFETDVAGVGIESIFNNLNAVSLTVFSRDGSVIGRAENNTTGLQFIGLATDSGTFDIAGLQISLVGEEFAGFAVDNITFGTHGTVAPVPVPPALLLLGSGLLSLGLFGRRVNRQKLDR